MNKKYVNSCVKVAYMFITVTLAGCNANHTREDLNQRIEDRIVKFEPVTLMVQEVEFEQDVAVNFKEHGLLVSLNNIDACGGDYSYTLPDLISDNTGCVRSGETFCSDKFVKYQVCLTVLEFSEDGKKAKTRVTFKQINE